MYFGCQKDWSDQKDLNILLDFRNWIKKFSHLISTHKYHHRFICPSKTKEGRKRHSAILSVKTTNLWWPPPPQLSESQNQLVADSNFYIGQIIFQRCDGFYLQQRAEMISSEDVCLDDFAQVESFVFRWDWYNTSFKWWLNMKCARNISHIRDL